MVLSGRMAGAGESTRTGGGARRWRIECGGGGESDDGFISCLASC